MKVYTIFTTLSSYKYTEKELIENYSCQYCGTNVIEVPYQTLHEDAYGGHFCKELDCIWEHVNETYIVEIDSVEEVEDEEE